MLYVLSKELSLFNRAVPTAGDGYYTKSKKNVVLKHAVVSTYEYTEEDEDFGEEVDHGELCVYFDPESWNVYEDNIIYTDTLFKEKLKELLAEFGISDKSIGYSEAGMQGDDYVSFDINGESLSTFFKVAGIGKTTKY